MSRRLFVLIALYGGIPAGLILALFIGWIVAQENATTVLQSADSPDRRYRAEFVREDPGVSSNYRYKVRVSPTNLSPLQQKLRELPFGPQYTALDANREPDKLTLRWTGPEELSIQCVGCAGDTTGKPDWRDIQLKYQIN